MQIAKEKRRRQHDGTNKVKKEGSFTGEETPGRVSVGGPLFSWLLRGLVVVVSRRRREDDPFRPSRSRLGFEAYSESPRFFWRPKGQGS
ncbi:uncharacterized protein SPSK_05742 [Sporothrix schenckii 1099-18]|uniref:Uncharacterized protein n=1 Tax=Sporothrix schenckii 1099-18 TaxID=1397361 RepID=A0A0F2LXB7_SPOSC|nr:uncharacterized protein SPSK_05742 [Sporothrix schenckii 1099-18]KJR80536.1 hypothetical protein SPSK_05742 [Sporothrix schenckii 1099-18]